MLATWLLFLFFHSIRQPYAKVEKYESIKRRRIEPIVCDTLQCTDGMQRIYATVPLSSIVIPRTRQRWLAYTPKIHHDTNFVFSTHMEGTYSTMPWLCYGCVLIFLSAKLFGIHVVYARSRSSFHFYFGE